MLRPPKSLYIWFTPLAATKIAHLVQFSKGICFFMIPLRLSSCSLLNLSLPHLTNFAYLVDKDVKYFGLLHCSAGYRVHQPPGQWLGLFWYSSPLPGIGFSSLSPAIQIWLSALSWCPDGQVSCHTQVSILLLSLFQSYLFAFNGEATLPVSINNPSLLPPEHACASVYSLWDGWWRSVCRLQQE